MAQAPICLRYITFYDGIIDRTLHRLDCTYGDSGFCIAWRNERNIKKMAQELVNHVAWVYGKRFSTKKLLPAPFGYSCREQFLTTTVRVW